MVEPALLDRMAWKAPGKNQDNTGIKHQCLGCPFGGVTSVVTAVRKSSYCHLLVTLHAALPTFHLKFQGFCWSQCKTDAFNFFFFNLVIHMLVFKKSKGIHLSLKLC